MNHWRAESFFGSLPPLPQPFIQLPAFSQAIPSSPLHSRLRTKRLKGTAPISSTVSPLTSISSRELSLALAASDFYESLCLLQERNKPMNRDASKSGAEAHMVFSVVSKQAMSLLSPHQDPGNCPAPPKTLLSVGWGKRYWQLQREKTDSYGKQEKAKMAQIHGEETCVASSIICSAYALHILIRMPQTGGTDLSRAVGQLHCSCGADTAQCGAGGTAADVSHHSSTGVTEL